MGVEPAEYACTITIIADTDNENRPTEIAETKNVNATRVILALFIGFFLVKISVRLDNAATSIAVEFFLPLIVICLLLAINYSNVS